MIEVKQGEVLFSPIICGSCNGRITPNETYTLVKVFGDKTREGIGRLIDNAEIFLCLSCAVELKQKLAEVLP